MNTHKRLLLSLIIMTIFLHFSCTTNTYDGRLVDFDKQWGLQNTGQKINGEIGIRGVDVNFVETYVCPDDFPIIAVLDAGFDLNHMQFSGVMFLDGWNFIDNDSALHTGQISHGTNILSIIVAPPGSNDQARMQGMLENAKILPIKIFDNTLASIDDIIQAINFAEKSGAKIVNCSFVLDSYSDTLYNIIKESNMIFVCAAGNDHMNNIKYPAAFDLPNVISVIGVNHLGYVSTYSNYSNAATLAAPGENVYVASVDGGYDYVSGSSIAVPFVTSSVAVLYYKYPDSNIKEVLQKNSTVLITLKYAAQNCLLDFDRIVNCLIQA